MVPPVIEWATRPLVPSVPLVSLNFTLQYNGRFYKKTISTSFLRTENECTHADSQWHHTVNECTHAGSQWHHMSECVLHNKLSF